MDMKAFYLSKKDTNVVKLCKICLRCLLSNTYTILGQHMRSQSDSNKLHVPASTNKLQSFQAVTDVNSLGLQTTQLPAAMAGAILNVIKYKGKFHGVICPTMPTGLRTV